METMRLRTMARKSVFVEGSKWEHYSVQQVLDLKGHRSLRWYYYNCSMLSFLPDILDELGIYEEWRIAKPGTDRAKGEELEEKLHARYSARIKAIAEEDAAAAIKMYNRHKRNVGIAARDKCKRVLNKDKKHYSKAAMTWRNQGH